MAGSTGVGVIRILCLGHDNASVGDSLSTVCGIHKEHFFLGQWLCWHCFSAICQSPYPVNLTHFTFHTDRGLWNIAPVTLTAPAFGLIFETFKCLKQILISTTQIKSTVVHLYSLAYWWPDCLCPQYTVHSANIF